jgi:hypothetical protein
MGGGAGFTGSRTFGASTLKGSASGCNKGRAMTAATTEHCRVREMIVVQR